MDKDKKFDLAGLTNALTDITVKVSEEELKELGMKKGEYTPFRLVNKEKFSNILDSRKVEHCVAGSPANTIINASRLGLKTALFASLGNDENGKNYIKFLRENNIEPIIKRINVKSGFCYIIVSPDGERTNTTYIGAAKYLDFDFERLKDMKMMHTSGYELVASPESVKDAIDTAHKYRVKVSFDLADRTMVIREKKSIESFLDKVDILFATEEEAEEFTGKSPDESLEIFSKICPVTILKKGKRGSTVKSKEGKFEIPIYPANVINTCGAGDSYAAGFLFGYLNGISLEKSGNIGSCIAAKVCSSEKPYI